jgi:hypothetical protein
LPSTEPQDWIIAYLTAKYGGNVHEKGIVTIASKSVLHDDPRSARANLADSSLENQFCSDDSEPDQWVCWDFGEMRVRLTGYRLASTLLKSWVIDGSLDGENWTEIDRQTDLLHMAEWFAEVSLPVTRKSRRLMNFVSSG